MSARVMAVWCPDWPAVAAARAEGHGLHLPLAVVGPRGVLACNAVARAVGVRRGLRRREAQFRCPELVVVAADPARDAVWFEPVVQALDAVVPGIEVLRPGLFVFSATGALRFHGGVEEVVTRVVDAVATAGTECQVGLADELPTAVLGARGSALLEPGGDADYLAGLPVDALVVEPALGDPDELAELVGLLHRLGVRTLGDFAALPLRDVATRFGEAGAVAHRIARAVPWRPPSVSAVPTGSTVEHRCDPPLERVDEAAFLGRRLAGELHAVLAAAGVACLRLSITARVEGGVEVNRVWRCSAPLTPEGTADRLRWQLEGWLTGTAIAGGVGGAVTALVLEPVEVVPAGRVQEGLWGEAGLAEARVHRALVRVQGLLGPESVRVPVEVGGRGPGDRVRSLPYGDAQADPVTEGPWPGALPAPSPSVVWPGSGYRLEIRESRDPGSGVVARVPLAGGVLLRTAAGAPVGVGPRGLLTGRPESVEMTGRRCALLGWSRPWPIDEAWWEPGPGGEPRRSRARIQVVPERAAALLLCCLVGDEPGSWTVEGVYE
ncbi:DNA polymerase Y family protein [Dietzia cercidiphylli]|uniref:DNA polymerase Y family protein n=1 Tax=Dietzia cercidiphylli TaxID=498199 RepID=A0ABN2IH29_9ACTN